MDPSQAQAAVEAAKSVASALGLRAEDAIVLHNSNRIAVRFLPCDVLARVGPARTHGADFGFELEVSRRLAASGAPCGEPDPRVAPRTYERDGFAITFWTYYEPVSPETSPPDFAQALHRLHAGLRKMTLPTPHFTDRVEEAQSLVGDPVLTPELRATDRELLANALRTLLTAVVQRGSKEQLLHGEPHPGNLLVLPGPQVVFIDFGLSKDLPEGFRVNYARLTMAIMQQDDQAMADAFRALGFQTKTDDPQSLIALGRSFFDATGPDARPYMDADVMPEVNERLSRILTENPVTAIPPDILIYIDSGTGDIVGANFT